MGERSLMSCNGRVADAASTCHMFKQLGDSVLLTVSRQQQQRTQPGVVASTTFHLACSAQRAACECGSAHRSACRVAEQFGRAPTYRVSMHAISCVVVLGHTCHARAHSTGSQRRSTSAQREDHPWAIHMSSALARPRTRQPSAATCSRKQRVALALRRIE